MYFEISHDPKIGRWSWHLVGATGTVIALGHGYADAAAALREVQVTIGTRNVPVYIADSPPRRDVDNKVLRHTSPRAAAVGSV
jgi:uncharacterized protein YegP (UPF0339 family)